jgi:hypothetical protein
MQKQLPKIAFTGLIALIILTSCSIFGGDKTQDWTVFAIEEAPDIDVQFKLPPQWHVDYAPSFENIGQWEVVLVPPRCEEDQEEDFADNCISLTINLKALSDFNKNEFLTFASQNITLNQSGSEETIMMGQKAFEVNGITIQRFNHKLFIGDQAVQMSIYFFETDSSYYSFITELPYDEREGQAAQNFDLLLNSLEETH